MFHFCRHFVVLSLYVCDSFPCVSPLDSLIFFFSVIQFSRWFSSVMLVYETRQSLPRMLPGDSLYPINLKLNRTIRLDAPQWGRSATMLSQSNEPRAFLPIHQSPKSLHRMCGSHCRSWTRLKFENSNSEFDECDNSFDIRNDKCWKFAFASSALLCSSPSECRSKGIAEKTFLESDETASERCLECIPLPVGVAVRLVNCRWIAHMNHADPPESAGVIHNSHWISWVSMRIITYICRLQHVRALWVSVAIARPPLYGRVDTSE